MIITVDSNVLLSIFIKDTIYQQSSLLLEKYSSNEFIQSVLSANDLNHSDKEFLLIF